MTHHFNPRTSGFRKLSDSEVCTVTGGSRIFYARIDQAWRNRSSTGSDGFDATLGNPEDTISIFSIGDEDRLGFSGDGGGAGDYSADSSNIQEIVVTVDSSDRFVGHYQDEDGVWAVYMDSQTNLTVDILVSLESGNAGWDYITVNTASSTTSTNDPGIFACGGIGLFGGVGGLCGATNPIDVYGYVGAGTPGLSAAIGVATNTEGMMEGWSVNAPGYSFSPETGDEALTGTTPGVSVTYGFSMSDILAFFAQRAQWQAEHATDPVTRGFVEQYYPDPDNYDTQPY